MHEAAKLGFRSAWAPPNRGKRLKKITVGSGKLNITEMRKLQDMIGLFDLSGYALRAGGEALP